MMSASKRATSKTMENLRATLDVGAVRDALVRGEITPIQARNLTKFISTCRSVRAKPASIAIRAGIRPVHRGSKR
jgi:hypothetical protein